ncbi:uncharacterized protein LOC128242923 isoform X2 [Mya arenaria]|uniref:uncharacterized protein LOC128242923 isoform X2 n=1 Tax=Mya arenaria TaxID=6604 RepID=UPI0022DEBF51|nr:uncharacterized protein LOC128242923 isoform X2 [Mya arenaria]
MDVRESLNVEENLSVITGEGQLSFVESDSFYARAPPQAASTVGRTKARRQFQPDTESGSFLEEAPYRNTRTQLSDDDTKIRISFSALDTGTRPKVPRSTTGSQQSTLTNSQALPGLDKGDQPPGVTPFGEWSVNDGQSSLGILNLDDMDLSSNNLLLDSPRKTQSNYVTGDNDEYKGPTQPKTEVGKYDLSMNSHTDPWKHEGSSQRLEGSSQKLEGLSQRLDGSSQRFEGSSQTLEGSSEQRSSQRLDRSSQRHEGSSQRLDGSSQRLEGSSQRLDGSSQRLEGSSQRLDGSSQRLEGSSQRLEGLSQRLDGSSQRLEGNVQPFARSQLNTVKKNTDLPTTRHDPVMSAIRQSLFGQGTIGEEGEDGETSVYNIEIEAEELHALDADFGEIDASLDVMSDEESPLKTPTNKDLQEHSKGEDFVIDSIYLRPGTTGEEQTQSRLPYLSKVSLFDGGSASGSELDTEDEIEAARKAQGERHEAAGEAAYGATRPGLVGEDNHMPMYQRQSAEGDVVTSPVPGDGGGGGDGSSGSDSDDGRGSDRTEGSSQGYHSNIPTSQPSSYNSARDRQQEGPRIRPMGDDLLSELRLSRFPSSNTSQADGDGRLSSRYLTPVSPGLDSPTPGQDSDDLDGDTDFDPGNRLEASGFNADDASALGLGKGNASNPFDLKSNSFGSFGLSPAGGDGQNGNQSVDVSVFGDEMMSSYPRGDRTSKFDGDWSGLDLQRTAASGSPSRSNDSPFSGLQHYTTSGSCMGEVRVCNSPSLPIFPRMSPIPQGARTRASQDRPTGRDSRGSEDRPLGRDSSGRQSARSSQERGDGERGLSSRGVTPDSSLEISGLKRSQEDVFKKPTLPPPKAANFAKSVGKSKSFKSQSSTEYGKMQRSGASSGQSTDSEYVDLEYRTSLSRQASEQRVGLCRVPSVGGTNEMDFTMHDEDFFGDSDAKAMLDADEVQFEEENKFSQNEEVKETASPSDSWAYKSIMSVARPSWLEGPEDEEEICVRISVGTFMRGRTEALGSLDGETKEPRPDFGMDPVSPPRRPNPLAVVEEGEGPDVTRTSGVGEYEAGTKERTPGKESDRTLTMSTLKKPVIPMTPMTPNSTKMSIGELSMMLNNGGHKMNSFMSHHASKSHKPFQTEPYASKHSGAMPKARPSSTSESLSPSKASSLPVMKGSSLNRSFPKVRDSDNTLIKSENRRKESTGDSGFKGSSVAESDKEIVDDNIEGSDEEKTPKRKREDTEGDRTLNDNDHAADGALTPKSASLNVSNHSDHCDVFSSPNASNYWPNNTGLFERMEQFKFSESQKAVKSDDQKIEEGHLNIKPDNKGRRKDENRNASEVLDTSNQRNSYHKDNSMIDHGYMPGHHIPDGTAYSQQSDYAHMDHRGELREDVAGVDDVELAESRGFDMLKHKSKSRTSDNDNVKRSSTKERTVSADSGKRLNANESAMHSEKPYDNLGQSKSRSMTSLKPTEGNSPMVRNTGSHIPSAQTGSSPTKRLNSEEQSVGRHESWTQTSLVLRQSVGLGPVSPEDVNSENHIWGPSGSHPSMENNLDYVERQSYSGNIPQVPLSSFKHNLLPNGKSTVPVKPHLLTKQSLFKTDFAQENLRRDYSRDVMERIYSGNDTDQFFHANITHSETCGPPDITEVHTIWQPMEPNETMDQTGADFPGGFRSHPSAHSTMHCGQDDPSHSQLSSGALSTTAHGISKFLPPESSSKVCPVEAPGVVQFREACCVGISRGETLPLTNPSERWMECFIEPKSLTRDGARVSLENFPFQFRQKKLIIDPHKTCNMDVMFLPTVAGAYVAHVQIFSLSFLKRDQHVEKDIVPVNVTFQAIAEDPWIKVTHENEPATSVDFGEVMWGSLSERTICIQNMGQANVPLRLAITSNRAWHCFLFEPAGRMSDVSVISGRHAPGSEHGRSIINISLPGADQPFSYHEVRVWCRPPDKQYNRAAGRQSPEVFRCDVEIEVDTPCSRQPKLHTVHMSAIAGFRKLHLQSSLTSEGISLRCGQGSMADTTVALHNAGNLPLTVKLGFNENRDVLSVSPQSLTLAPNVQQSVSVAFHPQNSSAGSTFDALLLMFVEPQGPMYEVALGAKVLDLSPRNINLLCDTNVLDFGGVPVMKTCVKRFRLKNMERESHRMVIHVNSEAVKLSTVADPHTSGRQRLEVELGRGQIQPIFVMYCPTQPAPLRAKITMIPSNGGRLKYSVKLNGYGGVSCLQCDDGSSETQRVQGHPCIPVHHFSMERISDVLIHNIGDKPAVVSVKVYKDLSCVDRLLSGQIVVQPSECMVDAGDQCKLELVVSMTEREFAARQGVGSVGAAICLEYQDQVESTKPYKGRLLVGLVTGSSHPAPSITTTPTRSSRPVRLSTFPEMSSLPIQTNRISSQHSPRSLHTGDGSISSDHSSRSYSPVNTSGSWNIMPDKLLLYCANRVPSSSEYEKFYIYNHNRKEEVAFELSWPAKMLSLIPDSGTISPRENAEVKVYPSSHVSQNLNTLPWSGHVIVTSAGVKKEVKVEIRQDMTPLSREDLPKPGDRSLVPISSNLPQAMLGTNRLGNLEVSQTLVQFPATQVGKSSEMTLELRNLGIEQFRWMFSSFAAPYLRKKSESSKEMFRVSYKVFDFSKQFGKLSEHDNMQLCVQFTPRSSGTFTQFWDLQTSGSSPSHKHSNKHDFVRVQLTGDGIENTPEYMKDKIDVENLLPKSLGSKFGLVLAQDEMIFPAVKPQSKTVLKVELKNSHREDIDIEVTSPHPPFYVKHHRLKIQRKKYLRLPVEFCPSQPGKYRDVVKFQGSKGENLILHVFGNCQS